MTLCTPGSLRTFLKVMSADPSELRVTKRMVETLIRIGDPTGRVNRVNLAISVVLFRGGCRGLGEGLGNLGMYGELHLLDGVVVRLDVVIGYEISSEGVRGGAAARGCDGQKGVNDKSEVGLSHFGDSVLGAAEVP